MISGTFQDVTDAASGVVERGKEGLQRRKEKGDIRNQKAYEAKKQEQLKKERWEKERERLAERAVKKLRR